MSSAEQGGSVDANNKKRGIFTFDELPVVFFFHQSVTEGLRNTLSAKIEGNGGDVSGNREDADVLLYDPKRTKEALLITAYRAHSNAKLRDLWLRPVAHLERSIDAQSFELLMQVMPDSGGGTRLKFSQDDKQHLGQYLASRGPIAVNSISIYNELVDLYTVDPEEYEWVQRHSATSWRAHYKNNKAYYDASINDYICQYGPAHEYHSSPTRELSRGIKRPHNDDDEGVENLEHARFVTRKRRRTCAALEEEDRRQRIIARREEEEEDSEEDLAPATESRSRSQNATPSSSDTIPPRPEPSFIGFEPADVEPHLEDSLDEETSAAPGKDLTEVQSPLEDFMDEETPIPQDKDTADEKSQPPLEDFVDEETSAPLFSEEEDQDEGEGNLQPPLEDSMEAEAPLFSEDEDEDLLFTEKEDTQVEVEEDTKASTQALSQALARFKSRRMKKALMVTPSKETLEDIGARKKLKEMQKLSAQWPINAVLSAVGVEGCETSFTAVSVSLFAGYVYVLDVIVLLSCRCIILYVSLGFG